MPSTSPAPSAPTASASLRLDDRGVSEVIGTILLVSLTVAITAGFAAFLTQALPGPDTGLATRLSTGVEPGDCPWDDGDDTVRIAHRGGEPLKESVTEIRIAWADQIRLFGPDEEPLGGPFEDGHFSIGEAWTSPGLRIAPGSLVILDIVSSDDRGSLVHTTYLRADAERCSTEASA